MELSYDFSNKSWYKRDGQTQTVYMRRRPSASSASTNNSPTSPTLSTSSPFLTPPTSRTTSRGSDQTQDSKLVDNSIKKNKQEHCVPKVNRTKMLPLPPPPVHPESKRTKARSRVMLPLPPPPPPPKSISKAKTRTRSMPKSKPCVPTLKEDDILPALPTLPESQISPPSSFSRSSAYSNSKDSMEKYLLPKRPQAQSKPELAAKAKRARGKAGKAERGARGAIVGGGGMIRGERRVGGAAPTAAIYVNELGPKGSWYFPVGTAPGRNTKKKEAEKERKGVEIELGLVKGWYRAFRRKVRLDT